MKGILLSGLLTFSPFTGHAFVHHANKFTGSYQQSTYTEQQTGGTVQNIEQQLWNDLSALNQLMENSDNMNSILQQFNQVMHDTSQLNQLSDQGFVHHSKLKHLPRQKTIKQINVKGIGVAAGDARVSSNELKLAADTVQSVSLPILQQNVGAVPAQNTHIILFSNPQTYAKSLQKAGVASDQLQNIVSETGGLTVGQMSGFHYTISRINRI